MFPHVSIIIPVHNAESFLTRCLDSAAAQTEDVEIICVDDASTDASAAMLDARARDDKRFRVVHRLTNGGESVARNQGVAIARGEYLMFLDHDDMLELNACKVLYQAAKKTNAEIAKGRARVIALDGKIDIQPPLDEQNKICSISKFYFYGYWWTAIYNTQLVKGKIYFSEKHKLGGDLLFLINVLLSSSSITCIDDITYIYIKRFSSCDSNILTLNKIKSVINARLTIIKLLNRYSIYNVDPEAYRFILWENFLFGVNLYDRCMDNESRRLCLIMLYAIKNMHNDYSYFISNIKEKFPYIYLFFVNLNAAGLYNILKNKQSIQILKKYYEDLKIIQNNIIR